MPATQNIRENKVHDHWEIGPVLDLFAKPFNDLIYAAHGVLRQNFEPNTIQVSTLLNIKTGACPEDCSYCSQSARYDTPIERETLLPLDAVLDAAKQAKQQGATRFCMGAAWRNPTDKNLAQVEKMVQSVKALGLETCVTLGMLKHHQAQSLKDAGLDYYNHNLDTSPEFYGQVITTRTYQDRLDTLAHVRDAGIHVCAGGIIGLGENERDRASLLCQLANLPQQPESVPINMLVKVSGTPLAQQQAPDPFDFIRTIAVARIMMPKAYVRLSAGRNEMNEQMQALCHFAGANSIFYGEKLLTMDNPESSQDQQLFSRLGLQFASSE